MGTTTPPQAPVSEQPPGRSVSGKAFVIAAGLAAAAFVAFLVYVSPLLGAWTRAAAPPPAPQEVAAGETGGQAWTATAVEQAPDEPCLEVRAGTSAALLCTEPRGPSLRGAQTVDVGGTPLLHGIVDARTALVRLLFEGEAPLDVEPAYVDFGFPLGFFATPLPAGATLTGVEALDRDGDLRGRASCSTPAAGAPVCEVDR